MVLPSPPKEPTAVPPSRARRGRTGDLVGRVTLVLVLVAFVAAGAWALGALNRRSPDAIGPPPFLVPLQNVAPGDAAPGTPNLPRSEAGAAAAADPMEEWIRKVAGKTDIPVRALRAYVQADVLMQQRAPACRISWATLAGIGRVESHHGGIFGARLQDSGVPTKPIIGVPLDGSPGVRAIKDTDGGRFDADTTWDRAVGPMQFIPGTWNRWGQRASGDGQPADPQNIDDAALGAARYLCSGGRDVGTGAGWWGAVMTYNNSVEYGRNVFSGADAYARASLG